MWKFLKGRGEGADHPVLSEMLQRAAQVREGFLDSLDGPLSELARRLRLATRSEVKLLNRQARELQNQVANLEQQLAAERVRAERAESGLAESGKATRKLEGRARELEELVARLEAERAAKAAGEEQAAQRARGEDKPARKSRARKKSEGGDEGGADDEGGGDVLI